MKILTDEEHNKYVHPCGKTGKELKGFDRCGDCEKFLECIESHAIIGFDNNRIMLEFKANSGGMD